jgi:hypothetical protein
MPENHAYSVNKPFSSQQGRQQPFAVVVIAAKLMLRNFPTAIKDK